MGDGYLQDPDVRLMLDVKAERPGAFEELVAHWSSVLLNYLIRQAGARDQAEDLVQEVFLKVYRARDRYVPTARFKTWLMTIATNVCLNRKRYEGHRAHLSLDAQRPGDGAAGSSRVEDEKVPAPSEGLERCEVQSRVQAAVAALPENQRMAVDLLRFGGLSYKDIAGAMGLSLPATKSLLNRAKTNLRESLSQDVNEWMTEHSPVNEA